MHKQLLQQPSVLVQFVFFLPCQFSILQCCSLSEYLFFYIENIIFTSHVVMHSRNHRCRFFGHIHSGEDFCRLTDTRQSLMEKLRRNVVEIQVNMVFFRTTSSSFQNLNCHGSGNDVSTSQIFSRRCISLHKSFSLTISSILH
jgi:hypothetical protein